jgi:hypothetical protein
MRRMLFALTMVLSAMPSWAQPPAAAIEYYHADVLGSVRAVSNEQGQVSAGMITFRSARSTFCSPAKTKGGLRARNGMSRRPLDYFGARQK